MPSILIATRNPHKTREFAQILGPGWQVTDLASHPELPEPIESGSTFEQNATIKAIAASQVLPGLVLADDSGLEVDALGGAPGVYSARYAGAGANDERNRRHLLAELDRQSFPPDAPLTARFHCALALAEGGAIIRHFHGKLEGRIQRTLSGMNGFGYDPLFVPDGLDQTLADLPDSEKNRISHRAAALRLLTTYWASIA